MDLSTLGALIAQLADMRRRGHGTAPSFGGYQFPYIGGAVAPVHGYHGMDTMPNPPTVNPLQAPQVPMGHGAPTNTVPVTSAGYQQYPSYNFTPQSLGSFGSAVGPLVPGLTDHQGGPSQGFMSGGKFWGTPRKKTQDTGLGGFTPSGF